MGRMAFSHGNIRNQIKVDRKSDLTDVLRWLLQLGNSLNKDIRKRFRRIIALKSFRFFLCTFICLLVVIMHE